MRRSTIIRFVPRKPLGDSGRRIVNVNLRRSLPLNEGVSYVLGHSNVIITLGTCTHVLPNLKDSLWDAVANILELRDISTLA